MKNTSKRVPANRHHLRSQGIGRRSLGFEILESRLVPATVLNTNDAGVGSLRAAVASGDATIDFDTNLVPDGSVITLTTGVITIDHDVQIDAPAGALGISVSGNNASQIFNVTNGLADISVVINNLHFVQGSAASGGAINNTETLSMVSCVFENNSAATGGAINNTSNLNLTFCVFTSNQATAGNGGGVFNDTTGTTSVLVCTFTANTVTGGGAGGGIANDGMLTTITNTLFQNNSVDMNGTGGAVENLAGATIANISGSNFVDNTADGSGGAIHNAGDITNLQAKFSGNEATNLNGGALASVGGSIAITNGATVVDSYFTSNESTNGNGGAIAISGGTVSISNHLFDSNQADNGFGGAIALSNGAVLSIDGCLFSANTATDGGAIDNDAGLIDTLTNSTIQGNQAQFSGGGLVNAGAIGVIDSVTFYANSTVNLDGGAICNSFGFTIGRIQNSTFNGNSAGTALMASGDGGAICNSGAIPFFNNNTVAGNSASGNAGGIDNDGVFNSLISNIIANNTAATATVDFVGTADDAQNNLIKNPNGFMPTTSSGNIFNLDPLLSPLANNGGPTATMALAVNSPAIDTGSNPNGLLYDQRGAGFNRTVGYGTDIGAYELQSSSTAQLINGTLYVTFTSLDDIGTFQQLSNNSVSVTVNSTNFGSFSGVNRIVVSALAGDDQIRLANKVTIPMAIDGGAGTDTLDFSLLADAVFIDIGSNPPTDSSFLEIERILGSQGDDYVLFEADADLTGFIDGMGGTNILDFSRLGYPIDLVLPNGPAPGSLQIANFTYGIGPLFTNNNIRPASANATNFLGRRLKGA